MNYIGIDPGVSGGIALLRQDCPMEAYKMPDTEVDLFHLISGLIASQSRYEFKALLEQVNGSPVMGPSNVFTFGRNFGALRMALIANGISFEEVRPAVWQKALGCLTKGDKNVSKAKAQELFPHMKIGHATADAVLICEYLRRKSQ